MDTVALRLRVATQKIRREVIVPLDKLPKGVTPQVVASFWGGSFGRSRKSTIAPEVLTGADSAQVGAQTGDALHPLQRWAQVVIQESGLSPQSVVKVPEFFDLLSPSKMPDDFRPSRATVALLKRSLGRLGDGARPGRLEFVAIGTMGRLADPELTEMLLTSSTDSHFHPVTRQLMREAFVEAGGVEALVARMKTGRHSFLHEFHTLDDFGELLNNTTEGQDRAVAAAGSEAELRRIMDTWGRVPPK